MAKKYSPAASKEVEKAMHEHKHEGKYSSRQQAIAVGLNKARKKGARLPKSEAGS